jgi:hypothetical protein
MLPAFSIQYSAFQHSVFSIQHSAFSKATTMGDFQAIFHRPTDTGIHTVEGNVAGARAASLEKKRQRKQEELEERKRKITFNAAQQKVPIHSKFAGGTGSVIERSSSPRLLDSCRLLILKLRLLKPRNLRKQNKLNSKQKRNERNEKSQPKSSANESSRKSAKLCRHCTSHSICQPGV